MDSRKTTDSDPNNFFKPYFKDYEHQFKIIKSTYESERTKMNHSLIFKIVEIFDKDIKRCIKNIEELFRKSDHKNDLFSISHIEIEKKIMNKIIPEFIQEKNKDYTFEQVTLCLHFLFHFLHKIKKVPLNFYQECVLLILILENSDKNNKEIKEKVLVEKKYLYDLVNLILISLKFSTNLNKRKQSLCESLIDLELAPLYSKLVKELKLRKTPELNSFLYIDDSPIAKEKKKKFKFERLILKMMLQITNNYRIVDQTSNFHKEFMNSLLDFAVVCMSNHIYDYSEKNNQQIRQFKRGISFKSLNRVNKYILRILNNAIIHFKSANFCEKEKIKAFIKCSLSVLMFSFLKNFVYEESFADNNAFDFSKIKNYEDYESIQKALNKKNYFHFEIVTKNEFHELCSKFETVSDKKFYLIKNVDVLIKNLEIYYHVKQHKLFNLNFYNIY